jgi:ribosomal protein S12 methylthiotransferase
VLVDAVADGAVEGRTAGQAPEVDGSTTLTGPATDEVAVGDLVRARVVASEGVDLVAEVLEVVRPVSRRVAVVA